MQGPEKPNSPGYKPSSPNPQLVYIKKLENFVKNVYSNCAGGPDIDDSVQGLLNAIQNDTLHNDALCAMLGGFPFEKWSSTIDDIRCLMYSGS